MDLDERRLLRDYMRELDEMRVLQLTVDLKAGGTSSYEIFEVLTEGLRDVDVLYESGRYFIADLIMAGHILKNVMTKVLVFESFDEYASFGRVLIATVRGDVHDLGKNVVAEVLRHNGFEVRDLGVDVSAAGIVAAVRESPTDIIILSGTLSASVEQMAATIRALSEAGLRRRVRVIVGGPPVTESLAAGMDADAYSATVMDCLRTCHEFMALAAGENS